MKRHKVRGLVVAVGAAVAMLVGLTPAHAAHHRVIAVGDSITVGYGLTDPDRQSWPSRTGIDRVGQAGGCLVRKDCYDLPPYLSIYRETVLAKKPDTVVLALGINDVLWGSSPLSVLKGIRRVVAMNDALGVKTYVATLTPLHLNAGRRSTWPGADARRRQLNRRLRATFPDRLIDFDKVLSGPNGKLPLRYGLGDGIHPNAAAYRLMGAEAARVIR